MKKEAIDDLVMGLAPEDLYPIWVISYNRALTGATYRLLRSGMDSEVMLDKVHVVVRESQVRGYKKDWRGVRVHGIPDKYRGWKHSCGMARQAAMDFARMHGHDRVIMLDDDISSIRYLYQGQIQRGPNVGAEKSGYEGVSALHRDPRYVEHTLGLFSMLAGEAFNLDKRLVMGAVRKQFMSHDKGNHQTKFVINQGMVPRQVMARNIKRIMTNDLEINLESFGVHGEDIGYAAQILEAGYHCFTVPMIVYNSPDDEDSNIQNSTVRTPENTVALRQKQYEGLQKYELFENYHRPKWYPDGSYMWSEINWQKYHKMKGTKPTIVKWGDSE